LASAIFSASALVILAWASRLAFFPSLPTVVDGTGNREEASQDGTNDVFYFHGLVLSSIGHIAKAFPFTDLGKP